MPRVPVGVVGLGGNPGEAGPGHDRHTVNTCCIHGDRRSYPTADIYMEIAGQEYLVTVTVLPCGAGERHA